MTIQPHTTVSLVHRFDASPQRVFDAWLAPEMIGRWMFGPAIRDEKVVRLTVDARVGGSFSFLVLRNGEEIDHVGEYRELLRPRLLVFTWGIRNSDSSLVTIDITPLNMGAELKLTHELHPAWADYASRTRAGWAKMLDSLSVALG